LHGKKCEVYNSLFPRQLGALEKVLHGFTSVAWFLDRELTLTGWRVCITFRPVRTGNATPTRQLATRRLHAIRKTSVNRVSGHHDETVPLLPKER
jgi:hypothetical protein